MPALFTRRNKIVPGGAPEQAWGTDTPQESDKFVDGVQSLTVTANSDLSSALGIAKEGAEQTKAALDPLHSSEEDSDDDGDIPIISAEELERFETQGPHAVASMSRKELIAEMEAHGLDTRGFVQEQMVTLQEKLNQEYNSELELMRENYRTSQDRLEKRQRREMRQKRREEELKDEQEALAGDPKMQMWIKLGAEDMTPPAVCLRTTNVLARAFVRCLYASNPKPYAQLNLGIKAAPGGGLLSVNSTLKSLDLSRCGLDDSAGKQIAKLLQQNTTLTAIDLDANQLGAESAYLISHALATNTKSALLRLDLSRNPLCDLSNRISGHSSSSTSYAWGSNNNNNNDSSAPRSDPHRGIGAIGNMLRASPHLRLNYLVLRATGITRTAGRGLAAGMQCNRSLVELDVGYNEVGERDLCDICDRLEDNRVRWVEDQARQRAARLRLRDEKLRRRQESRDARVREEERERVFQLKVERMAARVQKHEDRKQEEEEERQRQAEALRLEKERAKRAAAAKKKKKKGKKGKKGKKKKK